MRAYLPLVAVALPQAPNNNGPDGFGFATDGLRVLLAVGVIASDLWVGAGFIGERAAAVLTALAEARRTIVAMPVRYGLRLVRQRLNQATFREAVLAAYDGRCATSNRC